MTAYALDLTGLLLSNKIVDELQTATDLNSRGFFYIIPQSGPFFETNLIVKRTSGGVTTTLTPDVDYFLGSLMIGASASTNKNIYNTIIVNPVLSTGTYQITYQALGGDYQTDATVFNQNLVQLDVNPLNTSWEQISQYPTRYPDTPTPWYQQDATNQEDLITKLHELEESIVSVATQNVQNRQIDIEGDITGSGSVSIPLTLNSTGVAAGTYVKLTVNQQGLVTAAANVATLAELGITENYATTARQQELLDASTIPNSHIGSGDTEHSVATTTNNGFMSAADKVALNAKQYYIASNHIAEALGIAAAGTMSEMARSDHVHPLATATTTNAGVMSAADKTKLDGIEAGAQVNVVTSVFGRTAAVVVTKSDLDLSNVDNTADEDKPVSTAEQTALDDKQDIIFDYYKTDAQILALPVASNNGKIAKASDTRKEYICDGISWVEKTIYEASSAQLARKPVALYPLTGDEYHANTPTLSAYPFSPLYATDSRIQREFEITLATDTGFASQVDSFVTSSDSGNGTVTLNVGTQYIWRCRDKYSAIDDTDTTVILYTDWSDAQSFTTYTSYILTPTFMSITGDPDEVTETPTIVMSAFSVSPAAALTHASTTWEILDSSNTVVHTNIGDTTNLTSWVVPAGILLEDSIYVIKVTYNGNSGRKSIAATNVINTMHQFPLISYVAMGGDGTPPITLYKQDVDTLVKLTDPSTVPQYSMFSGVNCVKFSHDGQYLVIGKYGHLVLYIYKRSGDTFTLLSNPAVVPTTGCYAADFSTDGTYLAVGSMASPFIIIYKRSGDTFTKLADPATLPTGLAQDCHFSTDGTYLAVAHNTTPFITIYKRSGDTFTKLADPAILPPINPRSCHFSPDSTYLAVSYSNSQGCTIYKRSADVFTKLVYLGVNTAVAQSVSFSPDDIYLVIVDVSAVFVYKRSGDTFTALTIAQPINQPFSAIFSPDGNYLAVTTGTLFAGGVTTYKRSGDVFTMLADPTNLPAGSTYGCSWYQQGFGTTP